MIDNPTAFVISRVPSQPVFCGNFQPHELRMYSFETDYYQECCDYNKKGIEAIQAKLTESLVAREVAPGRLLVGLTLVTASDHLLD